MELKDLQMLYIEFNGYCNRMCKWCPNSAHPRNDKTKDMTMDWQGYVDLIAEIKTNCRKDILLNFFKYNEPFAFPELLKTYTDYARQELGPLVRMLVHTNGDYFKNIDLNNYTIDQINVMDYNNWGFGYGQQLITEVLKAEPAGLYSDPYRFKTPTIKGVFTNKETGRQTSIFFVPSWVESVETFVDRGGLLTNKEVGKVNGVPIVIEPAIRTTPCTSIHRAPAVHYNGDVTPCCHLYPTDDKHKEYIMGNINKESLEDILNSERAMVFAHKTKTMDFPDVCKTCADINFQH